MRWIRSLGHAAAFQQGTSPKNYPSKFRPSSPAQTPSPLASHDSAARHYTALPAACPLLPAPSTRSIALSKSALQHHHSSNRDQQHTRKVPPRQIQRQTPPRVHIRTRIPGNHPAARKRRQPQRHAHQQRAQPRAKQHRLPRIEAQPKGEEEEHEGACDLVEEDLTGCHVRCRGEEASAAVESETESVLVTRRDKMVDNGRPTQCSCSSPRYRPRRRLPPPSRGFARKCRGPLSLSANVHTLGLRWSKRHTSWDWTDPRKHGAKCNRRVQVPSRRRRGRVDERRQQQDIGNPDICSDLRRPVADQGRADLTRQEVHARCSDAFDELLGVKDSTEETRTNILLISRQTYPPTRR